MLTALLPLLAVGSSPVPPFDASAVLANNSLVPGTSFIEVQYGGRTRDAILYVPEAPAGAALPLVFNYHGFGSDAFQQVLYSDMNPVADAHGFAVIYPYGVGIAGVGRSFNGGSCCPISNSQADPIDDAGLAEVWASKVEGILAASGQSIDRSRVYSLGMSNGGYMSIRLGCTHSNLFAAIASVTGVLGNESPGTDDFACDLNSTEGRPIPFLHIHGTADATVPYSAVQRGIDVFRGLNRCEGEPPDGVVTYERNTTTCRSFCGPELPNVTLCSVEGGGHDWFGSPLCEEVGGRPVGCEDIDSTGQAWQFFSAHQR